MCILCGCDYTSKIENRQHHCLIHKIIQSNKPLHAQHRSHTYLVTIFEYAQKNIRSALQSDYGLQRACGSQTRATGHIFTNKSIFIHTRIHLIHSHSYIIMNSTCTFQPCSYSLGTSCACMPFCPFESRLCHCTIKCPLHIHITRTNTAQGRAPQRSQKFRVGENLQINRHCWPGQIQVVFFVSLFVY